MTARERRAYHRKIERKHVLAARYYLRWKNYAEAAAAVARAMQQATAADCAASEEHAEKIRKIQKVQRAAPTKGAAHE